MRLFPALLPLLVLLGCGGAVDEQPPSGALSPPPFEGSAESLARLGAGVFAALVNEDDDALAAFRLTEFEHNKEVWPELPASAPEVNFPIDYAWENLENRSRRGLARLIPLLAARELAFDGAECRGPDEEFETFVVRTDCWLLFTDERGDPREVQAFKDVLVRGGGLKVFRYYDEEPRARGGGERS